MISIAWRRTLISIAWWRTLHHERRGLMLPLWLCHAIFAPFPFYNELLRERWGLNLSLSNWFIIFYVTYRWLWAVLRIIPFELKSLVKLGAIHLPCQPRPALLSYFPLFALFRRLFLLLRLSIIKGRSAYLHLWSQRSLILCRKFLCRQLLIVA